jgi:hypothetical protein
MKCCIMLNLDFAFLFDAYAWNIQIWICGLVAFEFKRENKRKRVWKFRIKRKAKEVQTSLPSQPFRPSRPSSAPLWPVGSACRCQPARPRSLPPGPTCRCSVTYSLCTPKLTRWPPGPTWQPPPLLQPLARASCVHAHRGGRAHVAPLCEIAALTPFEAAAHAHFPPRLTLLNNFGGWIAQHK